VPSELPWALMLPDDPCRATVSSDAEMLLLLVVRMKAGRAAEGLMQARQIQTTERSGGIRPSQIS